MTNKFLKKLYILISFFFLFLATILSFFVLTISIKPIKINLLDYFDRKSEIFEKSKINEIGDVLLRFDTTSKNFEIMIDNLVYDDSYIPNILINIDLNFSLNESFIQPTIKIFDGDILIKMKDNEIEGIEKEVNELNYLMEWLNFFKIFNNVEVVNTNIKFATNKKSPDFLIDLKYEKNIINGHFSMVSKDENFLVFKIERNQNSLSSKINLKNFNVDFFKLIKTPSYFNYNDLRISGNSSLLMNKDNQLDEIIFDLLASGNISYKTNNGTEKILLDNAKLSGDSIDNKIELSLNIEHLNSIFTFGTLIDAKKRYAPNLSIKINEINTSNLLQIWPHNFKKSVYEWMTDNSSGLIKNFYLNLALETKNSLDIRDIEGNFNFSNTEIIYMDEMPKISQIFGDAEIKQGEIIFNILGGKSNELELNAAKVRLFDLDSNLEKADIQLEIFAEHALVSKYLQISPIDKDSYFKIKNLKGKTKIDLSLLFPLLIDLKAEEIVYQSNVEIVSAEPSNIYLDFSLDKLALKLDINNTGVNYRGDGHLMNSNIKFKGKQEIKNGKYIDTIDGNIFINAKDFDKFFKLNLDYVEGVIPLTFSYKNLDKGRVKIDAIGELTDLNIDSNILGKKLDFSEGKLRFILNPDNSIYNGFIDVKSPDLNFEVNYNFNSGLVKNLEVTHFKSPFQDFRVSINHKDEMNEVLIFGNTLLIPKITLKESSLNKIKNFKIDLNVNKLILNDFIFVNPSFRLEKKDNLLNFLNVKLVNSKDEHEIFLKEVDMEKEFSLKSNNASNLAKIFDYNLNTKQGDLSIEGKKTSGNLNYTGKIFLTDFVLNDGPFITDFLTLFSLKGLLQKLKDGGIFFENMKGKYIFNKDNLQISDALITGSELGIQLDAELDLKNDIFDAKGSIIPAYTINTLITRFPIVGDIISAGSPEEGLIGASFEIETIDDEIEISFNPISVFVPNLIKNFLRD